MASEARLAPHQLAPWVRCLLTHPPVRPVHHFCPQGEEELGRGRAGLGDGGWLLGPVRGWEQAGARGRLGGGRNEHSGLGPRGILPLS